MDLRMILIVVFFIIMVSIQFTLNKILTELKDIKKILKTHKPF
ncbi:MAG: Uncharacterized protein XD91_0528 [Clostridiales bacterium 38_11]|nr:MAG: Uncharacterized protein XD91_0528 [Clostridiales bacterium 38_11]